MFALVFLHTSRKIFNLVIFSLKNPSEEFRFTLLLKPNACVVAEA